RDRVATHAKSRGRRPHRPQSAGDRQRRQRRPQRRVGRPGRARRRRVGDARPHALGRPRLRRRGTHQGGRCPAPARGRHLGVAQPGWRPAAEMAGAAAVIGLVAYGIVGGTTALGQLRAAQLHFSGPSVWKGPERWLGGHRLTRWIATTATLTVAALALVLARRRLDHANPALIAGAAVFAYCLLGPYVLPWYVFWGLGAFALAWRSRLTWLALLHGAVLHLAYVPDPEIHGQPLSRLFLRSPLQRFQLDLFQVWVPLLELLIIVGVVVWSLPRARRLVTGERV